MENDDARRDTDADRGSADFPKPGAVACPRLRRGRLPLGSRNLEQGAVLHRDYVVFDPLPEDAFGAQVHLVLAEAFAPDPRAQRRMQVPFRVDPDAQVQVASAAEAFDVTLALQPGDYAL
ncbi:hypothetical protein NB717_002851 [Xanthomonas sacchari]|uniref:competence protein ComJ n=1 Tax=Xanthomonas sacchari TaxID=56458 RepID=UPI00225E546B|nr:competence protein ComJ [Xanthomonas sacchari]MCW0461783.1 hypothetical protein [Xanthomonas sacchari]